MTAIRVCVRCWIVVLCGTVFLATAALADAQEPVPTDTVPARPDTIVVPIPPEALPPDIVPLTDVTTDTIRPAPRLPQPPRRAPRGWAAAEWEWDREDLGRWHGLTALELVDQLPGIDVTRAGWYGQPAGVSTFGLGGGRLRVFLDGFELDPLTSTVFDLQHIAIADLEGVRVQRGLLETRVELSTFRLEDRRPFSQIEASTGLYGTRFIRGLFSTVTGEQGMLTLGIDVTDTSGWLGQQPFSANGLLGRWSHLLGERTGLEVEFRQLGLSRPSATAFPLDAQRRDLIFRGRHELNPQLFLEANLGRSWRDAPLEDPLGPDIGSHQANLRARYLVDGGWIAAGVRVRDAAPDRFSTPRLDAEVSAAYSPTALARIDGTLRRVSAGGLAGTELDARFELGPLAGFRGFVDLATGDRGVGLARDTLIEFVEPGPDGEPVARQEVGIVFSTAESRARGLRAGLQWQAGGATLGAAILRHGESTALPFGLPFDRAVEPASASPATGVETFASVPVFTPALRIEVSHTYWNDVGLRPYLPQQSTRGSVVFSRLFYDGNLEPTLRIDGYRRGGSIVPGTAGTAFEAVSDPYTWGNFFLQIRVLDVRLFFVWENTLDDRFAADLPGRTRGGARSYYGVRWHFLD